MLVFEDLGFRVAVFFIFLVFPATFFILRRKWRIAVARKEEINRLLVLASEEAARAEFEASFGYSYSISTPPVPSPSPSPPPRVCAVCFTPTPHRCARCKSVHYCSGKCQIVHWRQGHKNECHPSVNSPEINDEGVSFVGDSGKQFHFEGDIPSDISGNQYDQVEIAPEKHNITPSAHTPPELSINDDKSSVNDPLLGDDSESHVNDHIISDSSESRSSSSDDACIDDSVSDIDSVHDLNDDSCDSFSMLDNREPAMGNKNEEQSKPLEMEPNSGVPFNNNVFVSGDLKDKASSKTIGSLGSNFSQSDKNISNPVVASSGFWDGSLDYCRSKKHEQTTNAKPEIGGSGPDMHLQGLEASSPAYPGISNTGKVVSEPTSTVKNPRGPTRNRNSTILVSKEPVTRVKVINSDKDFVKSGGVGVVGETAEDSAALSSSASKKAKENDLEGSSEDALHSPVSKRIGVSPKAANGLTSGMKEPNSPAIRSVKAVPIAAVPSQVARPASSTAVGLKTSVLKVVEQFRPPRLSKQSDNIGKNIERAVFSYDVFVKLYHWNKVELRPCGLINCGNSCYANVILQCLAFTPPLTAYLLQGMHSKECVNKDWCFLCEFERLILMAKEGRSPLSPIGILSQLQKIGSHLANGREEDAHEFLRYAIDTMQYPSLQDAGANSLDSLQQETTLMGLTFGGYLRSKIKCTRCCVKSEKQERMMDLTVEISGDIETLEDALRKFTGTEPLDGENKYHCGRCKSYEKAKKKLNILEAPNILTIALKRFQSGKFGKLNKKIQFPEILNLAPYMRGGSDKSPIYRLYGVVVHLDIMNAAFSGHYVCYIRNSQNKWYKIDDTMVKAVELESVLTKGAYMLFYSRISPRAPRSIRSAIVCRDFQTKTKIPEVGPSQRSANGHSSRRRDASSHVNHAPDDNLANLGHVPPSGTSISPGRNILDFDSSSDSSSLFSNSDEVSSCTTDSNRDSISADDLSDYFFGYNAFFRHSSDSETSSSSSSSSSPEYTKHSPLSNPERYSSARPDDNAHSNRDVSTAETSGPMGGVSFLHSNNSKQVRKLVNISSSRESDGEKLGRSNPLDNGKSGVYLKRSLRTKTD